MSDSLQRYLEAAEGAGKVMAHAKLLVRLAEMYRGLAPSYLSGASALANYKSGVVVIHAENGAVATKLRQMAPTLAGEFSKRGVECNGLQVKVQVGLRVAPVRLAVSKPLSARTRRELSTLSASLPTSPLRRAIEDLLARAARRE